MLNIGNINMARKQNRSTAILTDKLNVTAKFTVTFIEVEMNLSLTKLSKVSCMSDILKLFIAM